MADGELAQLNIAHLLAPIESPTLSGFVSQLDRINALAETSPGFVWRLKIDVQQADPMDNPFGKDVVGTHRSSAYCRRGERAIGLN